MPEISTFYGSARMRDLMLIRIKSVAYVGEYRLKLCFTDGSSGEIDLEDVVRRGGVFAPLQDPPYFSKVAVDNDAGTICWPNGVDLDPDVLHSRATGKPIPSSQSMVH